MKRLFSVFALFFAVQCLFAQEVQLKGKLINFKSTNNDTIFLKINSSLENPIILKSAISKKGEFNFKYTEISTNYCELYVNEYDKFPLFLTTGDRATFSGEASSLKEGTVSGSVQTESMQKNVRMITGYQNELINLKKNYEEKVDSITKKSNEELARYIRNNPYLLSNLFTISVLSIDEYSDVYQLLDSALITAYPTNPLVEDFHNQVKKTSILKEGSVITDIILADENGKMINLESLRGKVVLVDFWASWCRPCRMEIPNFKKMYEAYHEAGFDIYSVSVDNDPMAWKKALAQEKMPWTNVRDDKKIYGNMFNVSSIPFTILIDKNGKIIAKGLRGQDLSDKIFETLSK
ncbi:MAG: TlpA family protein disulfide reductase [Bacteroidales bacterium]|nr:TlpA family protein disulfide reductase [Bacteroidales bacterium]